MTKEEKTTAIYVAYDEANPHDPTVPEKNLLRAVLLSALSDLKKPGEARRRATEYLLNKDDDYIFSFVSICDYLLIDPKRILTVTGLNRPQFPHPAPEVRIVETGTGPAEPVES